MGGKYENSECVRVRVWGEYLLAGFFSLFGVRKGPFFRMMNKSMCGVSVGVCSSFAFPSLNTPNVCPQFNVQLTRFNILHYLNYAEHRL